MKKVALFFFLLIAFSSCKKFIDVNQNPNNPTAVPPSTILANTTIALGFANANDLNRAASALVQHMAGTANQVLTYDVYNLDGAFDGQWSTEIYSGAVANLHKLIDEYSATSPAYSGIAKLQLAYIISLATDVWGEVPYSQAGQGVAFENPRFDKQEDIYLGNPGLGITSLFDLVKSGMADLDKTSNLKPGKDDLAYGGNLNMWKRAGNTLLLKFAIQISNRNPALAKSTIQGVIDNNLYINNSSADLQVPFGSSIGNQNPIYSFNYVNRSGDQMLSSRFIDLERSLNDTVRLAKFFTKPNGKFTGFDNGSTATPPDMSTRSNYNVYVTGTTGEAPVRLLTYFQVQFILAESALILGTSGDPNTYYQNGIRANMQKTGMTQGEIETYFASNPSVVTLNPAGSAEDKRKQIITQKYISWVGNGIEAFNDYRRTLYPQLTIALNAQGDNPNVIPTRLPYPPGELSRNPSAPTPRPKIDVKVWWAK